jgi:hypothetical protein
MLKSKYLTRTKYITKKQKGVLEDLFSGRGNEQEILEKWKVKRRTYCRWHEQPLFAAEFKRLLKVAQSECELVLARYAADVASKLVSLTAAEKDETARKACMDVIANHNRKIKHKSENETKPVEEPLPEIPPEMASRLLAALAGENEEREDERGRTRPSTGSTSSLQAGSGQAGSPVQGQ